MFFILLNFQRQVHLNFVCNIFLIGKFWHFSVFKTYFFKVDDVYKSFYFQRMAMQMFSKIKLLNDWYPCSKLILISQIRIMHHWSKEKFHVIQCAWRSIIISDPICCNHFSLATTSADKQESNLCDEITQKKSQISFLIKNISCVDLMRLYCGFV